MKTSKQLYIEMLMNLIEKDIYKKMINENIDYEKYIEDNLIELMTVAHKKIQDELTSAMNNYYKKEFYKEMTQTNITDFLGIEPIETRA